MSERSKKIFLGICIIVPFMVYCGYYYSIMFKNAPYRYSDFQNIELVYGEGSDLVNKYDSKTGEFNYFNTQDSLILDTVKLRNDDLLYLHRKAVELGFWNLPDDMTNPAREENSEVPRFILTYNYKEKSKQVIFDADFEGNPKMIDAARSVIDEVRRVISDAKGR